MNRSIATLLTTLLFSTAVVPNAMAQMQTSNFPVDLSTGSTDIPEQSASDSTKPTSMKTEMLPDSPNNPAPAVSTTNTERTRPSVDTSSVNGSYPAYCLPLPAGTKPGDWEYREAQQTCLYGN